MSPLGDGVRRDDADPATAGHVEVAEQEVGAQVRAAAPAAADVIDQVFPQVGAECAGEPLAPDERGVADDGVKAAAAHHLGELQGPVQGADRLGAGATEPACQHAADLLFQHRVAVVVQQRHDVVGYLIEQVVVLLVSGVLVVGVPGAAVRLFGGGQGGGDHGVGGDAQAVGQFVGAA